MNVLHVPPWAWAATAAALVVLLGADLLVSARRREPERLGESALWTAAAIAAAVGFGALIAITGSGAAAGQFFAGWLTEYSLSLDNLLVFVLLISSSGVAGRYHGRVLMFGILLALVLRGVLIGLGGVALHRFAWVEYLFGGFLIYVAVRMAFRGGDPTGGREGSVLPVARRILPVAPEGDGARLTTRVRGRRHATPLLILIIAIGVTDVLFAVDSIPAIFGLTSDPFLVFAANLFALLGLRHLYFLVRGLLDKLIFLSAGLAVILAFIGLKLISQAARGYGIDHIGPVPVPEVSPGVSLLVIAGLLLVTTVSSLAVSRHRARRAGQAGRDGRPKARQDGLDRAGSDAPREARQAGLDGPGQADRDEAERDQADQDRADRASSAGSADRRRLRAQHPLVRRSAPGVRPPQERRAHGPERPRSQPSPSRRSPAW
ncbi:MAG TPA: TerC/Alx family metal homeostasis membrane protein [Streptosporangiaceae bacterium]|nr:TerC/Alx family metal homeostasis membrane protein [Streptosporangiaceae bacterium]